MSDEKIGQLYQQETEFDILSVLIPHLRIKTFVDIGAEKGETAKYLMQYGFDGYLFEPLPKHHPVLEELVRDTGSVFFPYAIDDHDHSGILNIAVDENNQEMDYFHSLQRLEGDERVKHDKQLLVECFSLASLVAQGKIAAQIGLLKTDTEGNDLNVIIGMGELVPDVLMCEFFTEGIYSGWEDAQPDRLIAAARDKGYEHYIAVKRRDGLETCSLSPSSFIERQWGNLIFMKEHIYAASLDELLEIVQCCEQKLFEEVDGLRRVSTERLEVIDNRNALSNAKRYIINLLKRSRSH